MGCNLRMIILVYQTQVTVIWPAQHVIIDDQRFPTISFFSDTLSFLLLWYVAEVSCCSWHMPINPFRKKSQNPLRLFMRMDYLSKKKKRREVPKQLKRTWRIYSIMRSKHALKYAWGDHSHLMHCVLNSWRVRKCII